MGRFARTVGAVSIVAAPVLVGAADLLRMMSEQATDEVGTVGESGGAEVLAQSAAIARNLALYEGAAWLALAGALVTIPAVAAIWALSKDRSRAWAWSGLVLGVLGVFGQTVHLVGYYAHQLLFATDVEPAVGSQISTALESQPYFTVLFIPFFFAMLAYIPQAVGLRRAKVIPLWATVVVIATTVMFAVVESTLISSVLGILGLVVGLAPAAYGMTRAQRYELSVVTAERLDPAVV